MINELQVFSYERSKIKVAECLDGDELTPVKFVSGGQERSSYGQI
jgi:hypothetical protein